MEDSNELIGAVLYKSKKDPIWVFLFLDIFFRWFKQQLHYLLHKYLSDTL
jgi:hypothetical protein